MYSDCTCPVGGGGRGGIWRARIPSDSLRSPFREVRDPLEIWRVVARGWGVLTTHGVLGRREASHGDAAKRDRALGHVQDGLLLAEEGHPQDEVEAVQVDDVHVVVLHLHWADSKGRAGSVVDVGPAPLHAELDPDGVLKGEGGRISNGMIP